MNQKPKILIATPIFPPAIGGPAAHALNLARKFSSLGFGVSVLTYGRKSETFLEVGYDIAVVSSRLPAGLKHFVYFIKALRRLAGSSVVLVFDPFIVGVPVVLASKLAPRPLLARVEGDFLWESYIERTGEELTVRQFNERLPSLNLTLKEKLIYKLSRWFFASADGLVFSSPWREDILFKGYPIKPRSTAIISVPWPRGSSGREDREKVMLFAGRLIKCKNLPRLIRAFLGALDRGWQLEIIGDGPEREGLVRLAAAESRRGNILVRPPLSHDELLVRIASVRAFLLPSLSDISPNVILDCIKVGTPFLLSKEVGVYETLKDVGLFADPLDENDIKYKLRILASQGEYAIYRKRLAAFNQNRSWDDVSNDWLDLITKFTS